MALDKSQLLAALNKLKNPKTAGGEGNQYLWQPTEEKEVSVRIVPLASNPAFPFQELFWHYKLAGKTYISPRSWGGVDPIADFGDALIVEGKGELSKDEYKAIKKQYSPDKRTYVPIIVRGEEEKGVRFWGFGKTIYETLLEYLTNEEYGDITDVKNGRDIKVKFTAKENTTDKLFPETKITIRLNTSPLTEDGPTLKKWLHEQPVLLDVISNKPTTQELEAVLDKLVNGTTAVATPTPTEEVAPVAEVSSKPSKDVVDEFEKMFNQ